MPAPVDADGPSWLASYGPAEYDRSLLPKGTRAGQPPADQAALFIVPRAPACPHRETAPELPGQEAMFGEAPLTVHLPAGDGHTACGRWITPVVASGPPSVVTCGQCSRSRTYKRMTARPVPVTAPGSLFGEDGRA